VACSLFGEDQGLYVATIADHLLLETLTAADAAGVEIERIGRTIANRLIFELPDDDHVVTLDALRTAHEGFFPTLMGDLGAVEA
jgi:phosphoribosylformylglycinamidine synthase